MHKILKTVRKSSYYAASLMNFRKRETRLPRLFEETISVTIQY